MTGIETVCSPREAVPTAPEQLTALLLGLTEYRTIDR